MTARILVVEDHEKTLAAILLMFRDLGCFPVGVRSGEEALKILQSDAPAHKFEILITDLNLLGDLSGLDVIIAAREHRGEEIWVILMSADMDKEISATAKVAGADHCLKKPFGSLVLLEMVQKAEAKCGVGI